jgi:hypothetical protein
MNEFTCDAGWRFSFDAVSSGRLFL